MNEQALFQLRDDAELSMVTNQLGLLIGQTRALQGPLFDMTCSRQGIANHFEAVSALVSLTENNLAQMMQLSEFLNSCTLKVVKP